MQKKSVRTIKRNTRYYIVGYQYARNERVGIVPAYPRAYILPDYFFIQNRKIIIVCQPFGLAYNYYFLYQFATQHTRKSCI